MHRFRGKIAPEAAIFEANLIVGAAAGAIKGFK
jgi:hypothetical protein